MNRHHETTGRMDTIGVPEHETERRQDVLVVKCEGEKGYLGLFEIALSGVKRKDDYTFNSMVERNPAPGITRHMEPGDTIQFAYSGSSQVPFAWSIQGSVHGETALEAAANARRQRENTLLGLHAESMDYQFRALGHEEMKLWQESCRHVAKATPDRMEISAATKHVIGFNGWAGIEPGASVSVNLPLPAPAGNRASNRIPLILQQSQTPVHICCSVACLELPSETLDHLERLLKGLQEYDQHCPPHKLAFNPRHVDEEMLSNARKLLAAWLNNRRGYRYELTVTSSAPIPDSLMNMAANELLPMRHGARGASDKPGTAGIDPANPCVCDLSALLPMGYTEPVLFPDPRLLLEMEAPRAYNRQHVHRTRAGIELGYLPQGGAEGHIRFNESDRSRHCYILGATGTGKSTLVANMIIQDIASGQGVTVLDPHGDLFHQLLSHIPDYRLDDLIVINPSDTRHVVGINLLECTKNGGEEQIHFNINEMMEIFKRLYHSETMGPLFETYMRTAMLILMDHQQPRTASLMEIVALFQNRAFRKNMKEACQNDLAVAFWNDTAERSTGDVSLPNVSAYVTSKLNTFVHNRLMRNIVCQSTSTINFRKAMDRRKIVLINLAKGTLGRMDSQFLGMLILGKMLGAALSRSRLQMEKRAPHYLYIDEFQNFATGTMAHMMSEARKFGLCITLANQNTCQLQQNIDHSRENVMEAILGNVGSLLSFRIGPSDAGVIEKYTAPEINNQDLQYLPDYHVAAKLLMKGVPLRPFVFQTLPCTSRKISQKQIAAIQKSQQRDARPVGLVEEEFRQRQFKTTDRTLELREMLTQEFP